MRGLLSSWLLLVSLVLSLKSSYEYYHEPRLDTVYEWKYIDFKWKNEQDRKDALSRGEYDYTEQIPIDVDKSEDGRIFVTVIRKEGVPASLTTVSKELGPGGPLLEPYPGWDWVNKGGTCDLITNVFRVAIDRCNRLWVLDSGKYGYDQVCEAQILVFDLSTDELLKRIKIPRDKSENSKTKDGLLVTLIVETYGLFCTKSYVYIADTVGYGLVVYDGESIWRLESNVYAGKADAANITVDDQSFHLQEGVMGMALTPEIGRGPRMLYFKPLASFDMYAAKTSNIRNSKYGHGVKYLKASDILPSQSAGQAFSSDGTLFFGLTAQTSIACWNPFRAVDRRNVVTVIEDRERLQFTSGVKVIPRNYATGQNEELWIMTNRLQKIYTETMNFNDTNFRILKGSIANLVAGTICERPWDVKPWNDDGFWPFHFGERIP